MSYFSKKFQFQVEIKPLYNLLEFKQKNKEKIIDLTLANPIQANFLFDKKSIENSLLTEFFQEYNPNPKGDFKARESISEYYKQKGRQVSSENILLTTGTSESLSYIFKLYLNHGDLALVPSPSYPLFDWLAELEGIKLETFPCYLDSWENEFAVWKIDWEFLKLKLKLKPKILILVQPNNPTGMLLSEKDFLELETILIEKEIILVIDEVFSDYVWKKNLKISTPKLSNSITLSGISKVLALPNLKLGWMYFQGEPKFIRESLEYMEIISDSFLSVNYPIQKALPNLFTYKQIIQNLISKRILENLEYLKKQNSESFFVHFPLGGWYVPIQIPMKLEEQEFAFELLHAHNVLVHTGNLFGFSEKKWIVVSLLLEKEEFQEGIQKIINFVLSK